MNRRLSVPEKWIILGIPVLYLLGALLHFVYQWSGNNIVVGLFAPINESVWEHMKLAVVPTVLWWCGFYLVKRKTLRGERNRWFTATLVSIMVSTLTVPFLFYFYTQAFGMQNLLIDMAILLIGNILGQCIGLHLYRRCKGINVYLCCIIILGIVFAFMFFSLYPPNLPIFISSK